MGDVVMVSGGLDSLLARELLPKAVPVFIEWGQPYLDMERRAVAELYPDAKVVRMEGLPPPDGTDFYVPARNLMFACVGARFGSRVCLAGMRDEMCADKSPDAFREMSRILTAQCRTPVEVFSPFWNHTKGEAVADYLGTGGSEERLLRTVSCYGAGTVPCLDCEACFRRFVAIRSNGLGVLRPSESVVRSYGLHRIHSSPLSTAHATLRALHASGSPVFGVELEEVVATRPDPDGLLIVYTRGRQIAPELIARTLSDAGVRFDGVLTGVPAGFFDFH